MLFLYYFSKKFLMNLFKKQYFTFLIARSYCLLQFQVWFFLMLSLWSHEISPKVKNLYPLGSTSLFSASVKAPHFTWSLKSCAFWPRPASPALPRSSVGRGLTLFGFSIGHVSSCLKAYLHVCLSSLECLLSRGDASCSLHWPAPA